MNLLYYWVVFSTFIAHNSCSFNKTSINVIKCFLIPNFLKTELSELISEDAEGLKQNIEDFCKLFPEALL